MDMGWSVLIIHDENLRYSLVPSNSVSTRSIDTPLINTSKEGVEVVSYSTTKSRLTLISDQLVSAYGLLSL
jgi:hypothetical protein